MSSESLETKASGDAVVQKIGNNMLRTLYGSFRLSQGSLELQRDILSLAAHYYRNQHPFGTLQNAHRQATEKVGRLVLPPGHSPQNAHIVRDQFMVHWKYFGSAIPHRMYADRLHAPALHNLLGNIVGGVAQRDVRYLQPKRIFYDGADLEPRIGRSVGATGRDARQSFMRDYILEGVSIRDEVLDSILRDARRTVVDVKSGEACANRNLEKTFTEHLPQVASYWEEHHPRQRFIDPAVYIGSRLLESIGRRQSAS